MLVCDCMLVCIGAHAGRATHARTTQSIASRAYHAKHGVTLVFVWMHTYTGVDAQWYPHTHAPRGACRHARARLYVCMYMRTCRVVRTRMRHARDSIVNTQVVRSACRHHAPSPHVCTNIRSIHDVATLKTKESDVMPVHDRAQTFASSYVVGCHPHAHAPRLVWTTYSSTYRGMRSATTNKCMWRLTNS